MPTMTLKNPYKGINAHLHSMRDYYQPDKVMFCIPFQLMGYIISTLNQTNMLPDDYHAQFQPSLQIDAPDSGTIFKFYNTQTFGTPLVQIEIVTDIQHISDYLIHHQTSLENGIVLIELFCFHDINIQLPDQLKQKSTYWISVSQSNTETQIYSFHIDEPLPQSVEISIDTQTVITMDFQTIYQTAFEAGRWFMLADHNILPHKFESYSKTDQEQIRAVMQHAKELADAK